jgi:hypothetical protein
VAAGSALYVVGELLEVVGRKVRRGVHCRETTSTSRPVSSYYAHGCFVLPWVGLACSLSMHVVFSAPPPHTLRSRMRTLTRVQRLRGSCVRLRRR